MVIIIFFSITGQANQPVELNISNNISLASLNWGKKDEPIYVIEDSGVVGLNFHQSKEILIQDSSNGVGTHFDVRFITFYMQN